MKQGSDAPARRLGKLLNLFFGIKLTSGERPTAAQWTIKTISLVAGIGSYFLVYAQTASWLGEKPALVLGTAALACIFLIFTPVRMWVTSIIAIALLMGNQVFGPGFMANAKPVLNATAGFPIMWLFIGAFIMGLAMAHCGLHERLAFTIISFTGKSPTGMLFGLTATAFIVSMVMPNTADVAIMIPIAIAMVTQLEKAANRPLMFLASIFPLGILCGSNIGGMATLPGTTANGFIVAPIEQHYQISVGFTDYMIIAAPFAVIYILTVFCLILWPLSRRDGFRYSEGREVAKAELKRRGPMNRKERAVISIICFSIICWLFGKQIQPTVSFYLSFLTARNYEAVVAMSGGIFCLLTGLLPLRKLKDMEWETLALLGCSFVLAMGIEGSGLSKWLSPRVAGELNQLSAWGQLYLAAGVTIGLTAFAANTATASVLMGVVPKGAIGSIPLMVIATMGSSVDFMLPVGSSTNAMVWVRVRNRLVMVGAGLMGNILGFILLPLYARWWVPFVMSWWFGLN